MVEYEVEPKSRSEIRMLAYELRRRLKLENELFFPIIDLLDVMEIIYNDFSYEVVEDNELEKGIHAETDVRTGKIRIRQDVFDGACEGNGRDRMTIAHEIGHYILLCVCGFKFHRKFSDEVVPAYKSPEWQAKCFAGELLMNYKLISNLSIGTIARECGVSLDAARYHHKLLHKDINRCA